MTDLFDRPTVHDGPSRATRAAHRERRAAKRRRRRRRRAGLIVLVAFLAVGAGGYYMAMHAESLFGFSNPVFRSEDYPGPGEAEVEVTIEEGSTGRAMGRTLVDAGVVASVKAFVNAYESNPGAPGIQPGVHTLMTRMTAEDAVAALVANESKIDTKFTIPEGFTKNQIVERASSVTGIPVADFEAALLDPVASGLPAEAGGNHEGWLFPTTYVLDPDETAASLVQKMVAQTVLELDSAGVPVERRQEVLTKASIVQAEAPAGEFGKVATVINNRLQTSTPLGMDAIDAYGLGKPSGQILTEEFNNADLPYASRVNVGLPPTPIGSPGTEAVAAVLNPTPGPWLWYVTVNLDTGETKYTDDYNEFLVFKREFQEWQKANPQ